MSKINATYSSGYYLGPDADYRKLEDERALERRKRRREGRNDGGATNTDGDADVKRQTFAIPFDLICLSCQRRIARGSHVYANRRATTERYLGHIRIWELEVRCRYCQASYYLRTDPATPKETGGYVCARLCRRVEGDFYSVNKMNEEDRAAQQRADEAAALDPLQILERENEATRRLAERNREIEEDVEARADADDTALLHELRAVRTRTGSLATGTSYAATPDQVGPLPSLRGDGDDDDDDDNEVVRDDDETQSVVMVRWQREVARRGRRKARQEQHEEKTRVRGSETSHAGVLGVTKLVSVSTALAVPSATPAPPRNVFLLADDEDEEEGSRHDDARSSGGVGEGKFATSGLRSQGIRASRALPPSTVVLTTSKLHAAVAPPPPLRQSVLQTLVDSDDDT